MLEKLKGTKMTPIELLLVVFWKPNEWLIVLNYELIRWSTEAKESFLKFAQEIANEVGCELD